MPNSVLSAGTWGGVLTFAFLDLDGGGGGLQEAGKVPVIRPSGNFWAATFNPKKREGEKKRINSNTQNQQYNFNNQHYNCTMLISSSELRVGNTWGWGQSSPRNVKIALKMNKVCPYFSDM